MSFNFTVCWRHCGHRFNGWSLHISRLSEVLLRTRWLEKFRVSTADLMLDGQPQMTTSLDSIRYSSLSILWAPTQVCLCSPDSVLIAVGLDHRGHREKWVCTSRDDRQDPGPSTHSILSVCLLSTEDSRRFRVRQEASIESGS